MIFIETIVLLLELLEKKVSIISVTFFVKPKTYFANFISVSGIETLNRRFFREIDWKITTRKVISGRTSYQGIPAVVQNCFD